ncbi:hypothetical protein [Sinomonas sp. ASV322]|uniref:tetratricopeptide repeat protein n=1 Tax=Sinomonas sp. ASV322 TaxID=3041920 RepID=UPI0027DAFBF7|nr:hypothetical protein [Sinomonas sp. ASV322]MDQ4502825.1 hypothetical protein [Sinomonas sp. ASV322]
MYTAVRLLSAVPWFNEDGALAVLEINPESSGQERQDFDRIRSSGILRRNGEIFGVSEPLRTEMRRSLFTRDEILYRRALGKFVEQYQYGLRPHVESVMGLVGASLNFGAISCVASQYRKDDVDSLVERAQAPTERDEASTASDIARLLETYSFKRDRLSEFFHGLAHWGRGARVESIPFFEQVLEDHYVDRPSAISAHLIGTHLHATGALFDARRLVEQAIEDLRQIEDQRGLAMALSTLGRIERDIYRKGNSKESISRSISALREAVDLSRPWGLVHGRASNYLAQALFTAGAFEDSAKTALDATNWLASGDQAIEARLTLAIAYRQLQNWDACMRVLDDAYEIADRDDTNERVWARLLNVSAATRRMAGQLSRAVDDARRSVGLGRRLGDVRHIAHSAHTLAGIQIDRAIDLGDRNALDEAQELLTEAREILVSLQDTAGVAMVDNTRKRLLEAVARMSEPDASETS